MIQKKREGVPGGLPPGNALRKSSLPENFFVQVRPGMIEQNKIPADGSILAGCEKLCFVIHGLFSRAAFISVLGVLREINVAAFLFLDSVKDIQKPAFVFVEVRKATAPDVQFFRIVPFLRASLTLDIPGL